VDWVTDLIEHVQRHEFTRVEPKPEYEKKWTEEVVALGEQSPFMRVNSWLSGINSNVQSKQKRVFQVYAGGAPAYREHCQSEVVNGYAGFSIC
jgi:DNA/RNA-binding domain of Phe-tRNA-synthetase-like protein